MPFVQKRWPETDSNSHPDSHREKMEHPIIFSGPMVRAILESRKTQTRRVIPAYAQDADLWQIQLHEGEFRAWQPEYPDEGSIELTCPYGKPGDRLWVRETFLTREKGKSVVYRAVVEGAHGPGEAAGFGAMYGGWRPSIFMPRSASRIDLEIIKVRVQRVQDIDGPDAIAEGCKGIGRDPELQTCDHLRELATKETWASSQVVFRNLWDSINAKRGFGWEKNPWVWVVEFKRTELV